MRSDFQNKKLKEKYTFRFLEAKTQKCLKF